MVCSVSKNSNLTASLRAKKLQSNFPRFCQTKLTKKFILRKLPKLIKMQEKLVVYDAKPRWLKMYITNRYMLQKPSVWQVKLT